MDNRPGKIKPVYSLRADCFYTPGYLNSLHGCETRQMGLISLESKIVMQLL